MSIIKDEMWRFPDPIPGPPGKSIEGPPGKDSKVPGPKGVDGRSIEPAGEWSAVKTYRKLALVSFDDATYVSTSDQNKGNRPSARSRFWQLVCKDGVPGKNAETLVVRGGGGRLPLLHDLQQRVSRLEEGDTIASIADEAIIIGNAIRATSTGVALGADGQVVGLAVSAASPGGAVAYLTEGQVTRADWTAIVGSAKLVPSAVYYLAPVPGRLSVNPPMSTGQYVVRVATALDETTLDVEISQPVLL